MKSVTLEKWRIYTKERFPISVNLINAFVLVMGNQMFLSKVMESAISWETISISTIFVFMMYFIIRLVDEFKDYEEDCVENPERPVQRGVITLRELSKGVMILIVLLLFFQVILNKAWVPYLAIVVFFVLMTKEFFIGEWLTAHPRTYVVTHNIIIILIDYYLLTLYSDAIGKQIEIRPVFFVFEAVRILANINQDYFERCFKTFQDIGKWMIMHFTYLFLSALLLGMIMIKYWGVIWVLPVVIIFFVVLIVYIYGFFVQKNLNLLYRVSQIWFAFCYILPAI